MGDECCDPQQDDRTDDGGHQIARRADRDISHERKEPPAQDASDNAHDEVCGQSRTAAFDDEVCDPSGRQPQ